MSSNSPGGDLAATQHDLHHMTAEDGASTSSYRVSEDFRRFANCSPDIIYRYDLTSRQFLFINKQALAFYGLDEKTGPMIAPRILLPRIYPEDLGKVRKAKKESLEHGTDGGEVEYRMLQPDGSLRWMQDRWFVLRDETGNPVVIEGISRDNTDYKRMEEALRESEGKYRLVVENAGEAIYIAQDGRIKFPNRSALEFIGYTEDELTSRPFTEFIHPDDRQMVFDRHVKRLTGEEILPIYCFRCIARDRAIKWGEIHAVAILWEGRPATLNFLRDVTERKRAEDAFQASEERFSRIFRMSPDIMTISRLSDGVYVDVNEQYTRQAGYTREEAIGKPAFDLGVWVEHSDRDRMVATLRAKGEIQEEEYRFRCKDGTIKTAEVSARIITIDGDAYVLSMNRDITEKIALQMAQRESEEKYRLLAEQSLMGIFIIQRGVVRYANQAVIDMTGYTREEAMNWGQYGSTILIHPDDLSFVRDQLRKEESGDPDVVERYEWRMVTKSGAFIWVESFSKTILFEGSPADFVMLIDITDRKEAKERQQELEERLNRAEKMEALGVLAGGVAHDLNNVLGIVVGYAELLLNSVDASNPLCRGLESIMSGGQKAAAIVADLLTLARRGVAEKKVLNLNEIVVENRQSAAFETLASYHPSVRIDTDLEPDLPNISGSAVHLEKTVFNLVSNACEAMPHGGRVTITTTNQYLDTPIHGYDEIREGDYAVLSVTDTGEGIQAADLKHIFEPFYTKKVMGRSGTGLGLAVVWGTVKDHQGYINVQSEEGKGSTFTMYFPVTRESVSDKASAVSLSEYMGKGESILIVDDVKGQRDLAAEMLRTLHYTVASVASGEEAVAFLKGQTVDLLILDMIMEPGMDGLDTYKSAIEIRPKQKAIIVSGYSETDRVRSAQNLGAGTYVKKPYAIEKLGLAVRQELDRVA